METISAALVIAIVLAVFAILVVVKTAVVVPQQNAFVVERLGKFNGVLDAGFHVLLPFFDVIRYRHTLKEQAIDIPEQICITKDNVQVAVDGILYLKVLDAQRASYGIADYYYAISQLAQTALRSEIGKIDLDRTFEERTHINAMVIAELDKATGPWGVKVLRYEIKNITPPEGRARRHGEADARRAGEARGDPHLRGRARRRHQQRRGQEAAGHQGVGGRAAAADQRGRGPGLGDPRRRERDRRGAPQGRRRDRRTGRRRGGAAPRGRAVRAASSASSPRTTNTVILPATLSDVGSMIALAMNVLRAGKDGEAVRGTVAAPPRAQPPAPRPPIRPPGL